MPTRGRRPLFFRIVSYTPKNKAQQERIKIPQPPDRPIRLIKHDAVKRQHLRTPSPDWYVLHRRGPRRYFVGSDYQEGRAVPGNVIRGSLPERIVYLELLKRNYQPNLDFSFQSSQEGGRYELGGLVVDFLFDYLKIALRVQGYTHEKHIQQKKDEEQAAILEDYGFQVLDLWTDTILDAAKLEQWFRRYLDFPGPPQIEEET